MCYHPTPKDIQHYIDFGWFEGVYSFILQADPGRSPCEKPGNQLETIAPIWEVTTTISGDIG